MKRCLNHLLLITIATLACSCDEMYENIDPATLNIKISHNPNIKTPTDLFFIYDPRDASYIREDPRRLTISSKDLGDNKLEITAVINVNDDDALAAEKYVIIANHDNVYWKVLQIKYNWKNWEGYGHTDWGI